MPARLGHLRLDVNDLDALRTAISAAEQDDRPSLISVRTVLGYGSPNKAGTAGVHGSPLGDDCPQREPGGN